ncbi:MAG TPA: efflux RND transporter periplasmic adaptor subunit [Bryobacteraceae bacterium]|nr:efflux RND transporter periplasmic adaptor subunit [Bryobacteraceae bacterium]
MRIPSVSTRTISIFVVSTALAASFIYGSYDDRDQVAHAKPSSPPSAVTVFAASPTSVPIVQEFIGATFALDTVQVNSRVNGYIDQWLFRPGDQVTKGQLLYVIDQRTYRTEVQRTQAELARAEAQLTFAREGVDVLRAQAELAEAEATLIKAEQDVARVTPLVTEKALPAQDLDTVNANERVARSAHGARRANLQQLKLTQTANIAQSEALVAAARAALRNAELNLEFTEIRSPTAGRIGETKIQVGGLASASSPEPLTLISPLDPIYVEFTVTEQDHLEYRKGRLAHTREASASVPLELILADGSVYPQPGQFRYADRAVDVKTGTLKLIAAFPNRDRILLPGQFSRVRMRTGTKDGVYLVPQRAVVEQQGIRFVLLVDENNRVVQRTITASERVGASWVVEQGLSAGDRVILDGLQKATPGSQVAPRTADGKELR